MINFIHKRNFSSTYRALIISSIIWSYLFHTIRTKDMTTIQHNSWDSFFILLIFLYCPLYVFFYGPLYVILLNFILLIFLYGPLYGLFYVFFWIIFLYIILLIFFYGLLYGPLYGLLLNVVKIAHTNRAHICVLSIVYFCG